MIASEHQNGASEQCIENMNCNVECNDDCTGGKQCTNKRIQNTKWKSVEKKQTENGKDYGLFMKENCNIGDLIIKYVRKVVHKQNKNNGNVYYMTLFHEQLWINSANMGGLAMYINHS